MDSESGPIPVTYTILVRPAPVGQFTAVPIGFPEIRAVAATEADAVEQARKMLAEYLASARMVLVRVPPPTLQGAAGRRGHVDPNDPIEQMYLEELARFRQEDLEQTLREYEQECSGSSSTPTT